MVKNNKLIETLHRCVKNQFNCKGCFYGDGSNIPSCMFSLMNDVLFFFRDPVPSTSAYVLPLQELEEKLADKKDHIAFCEYINSSISSRLNSCATRLVSDVDSMFSYR